jgi:hypothetical protein
LLYFIQSETIFRGLWLKGDFMRKTALALIAAAGVAAIVGAPAANAAATCWAVRSFCGPADNHKGTNHEAPASPSSVPEPGTLALLAAGVTAIGGAAWRRRRRAQKKD